MDMFLYRLILVLLLVENQCSGASGSGEIPVAEVAKSMMPPQGLPYVSGQGSVDSSILAQRFQSGLSTPFSLNRNLRVYVTLVNCCKCV